MDLLTGPTSAPAGSDAKLEVLRLRAELGLPLFHDQDSIDCDRPEDHSGRSAALYALRYGVRRHLSLGRLDPTQTPNFLKAEAAIISYIAKHGPATSVSMSLKLTPKLGARWIGRVVALSSRLYKGRGGKVVLLADERSAG